MHTHALHTLQEQEKVDLLESYQALSDEAEKLDSTVQHSLGETSTTRMELATLTQVGEIWKAVIKIELPPLAVFPGPRPAILFSLPFSDKKLDEPSYCIQLLLYLCRKNFTLKS